MEQQTYEREIDLIQLFKAMWKKLWVMILAGICGAVLIGGYKLIPMIQNLNDPEAIEEQEKAYEKELKLYKESYELAEKEIKNIEDSIKRQNEYNEEAIQMQINPYDVQVGTAQFYVDTNYQINLEAIYQNRDISNSVLNAYASIASNGTLYNYVSESLEEPEDIRYLKEIITVRVDYDNRMINVEAHAEDSESCEEIISLIKKCFDNSRAEIVKNVGEHDLQLVTESYYTTVDLNLETLQKNNRAGVEALNDSLNLKSEEFEKMKEPVKKVNSVGTVVKSGIKYILVGGVLGGFLAAAVILFLFLIDTTIKEEKDVAFYLGLPVIGSIPTISGSEKTVKSQKRNKKNRLNQYSGM